MPHYQWPSWSEVFRSQARWTLVPFTPDLALPAAVAQIWVQADVAAMGLIAVAFLVNSAEPRSPALIAQAARDQIGKTVRYDPSYQRLDYPGGDVPMETGVCTDVVVRALRFSLGLDLQRLVHEDMRRNFEFKITGHYRIKIPESASRRE